MNSHSWWFFAISTFLICFAPGPNMLHMLSSGAKYGIRRTLYSMGGCFLAVTGMIGISVAGVGAILKASPVLFDFLRYAGAAYLVYLGVQAWRAPVDNEGEQVALSASTPTSGRILFRNGFLIGISNPKALLFAGAFFPQFIDTHAPEIPQLVILFTTFAVIEITCYSLYALGGRSVASMFSRASIKRAFNRITGTMFGFFGILLIAKSA